MGCESQVASGKPTMAGNFQVFMEKIYTLYIYIDILIIIYICTYYMYILYVQYMYILDDHRIKLVIYFSLPIPRSWSHSQPVN